MRRIALILLTLALLILPAEAARQKHPPRKSHARHSRSTGQWNGKWEPGSTISNPLGLPPWLRRPSR